MRTLTSYWVARQRVLAAVTKPNENTLTMMPVRSLVYTPKKYKVEAGSLLSFDGRNNDLLLATHHVNSQYDVFMGLHLNAIVSIDKRYSGINSVTKLKGGSFNAGTIQADAVSEVGKVVDEKGMQVSRNTYYLGVEVTEQDLIDGKSITAVQHMNGIYRVEVR